jgi:hypothetical protein
MLDAKRGRLPMRITFMIPFDEERIANGVEVV